MRRLVLCTLIAALIGHSAAAAPGEVGVVLMHGKGGSPAGYVRALASALESKGYLVSAPAMPWSEHRIYDATFDQAMVELDREVDSLRKKGAKLVVVAGHSLGANAALGYAASRDRAGGIIALAPGITRSSLASGNGSGRTSVARASSSPPEKARRSTASATSTQGGSSTSTPPRKCT